MERIYALGVSVIEFIQDWFADYDNYFKIINEASNPHYALEWAFPFLSIIDSVFASQLLLCIAFGGWLNAVMKWWLLEDRPYWWVRETDFYAGARRPLIRQTAQTCETGPGCPSGHAETAAMMLVLTIYWIEHTITDRKWKIPWWKSVVYPFCGAFLLSVMLARMFVGTHFPHQVLVGALLGGFLAPMLCIYVTDPYIWQYGGHADLAVSRSMQWHLLSVVTIIAISVVTYFSLTWCGFDPQWSIKLAFRWCESPASISVSTTPMYALAHCTGHLLGWALAVTPAVAQYRHYTKNRSLLISIVATALVLYAWQHIQANISRDNAIKFYLMHFAVCATKVPVLIRVVPYLAMWPYKGKIKGD